MSPGWHNFGTKSAGSHCNIHYQVMFKPAPITVKIAFWILIVQLVAWPLFEYMTITDFFPPANAQLAFGQGLYLVALAMFTAGTLVSVSLVGWEALIARKTKEHYWTLYVLIALIALCWLITLTFHPAPTYLS